jgi:hypothetical protein
MVQALIEAPAVEYRALTPSKLPLAAGVYVISTHDGEILRAGKTGCLRNRLYRNHLMGHQDGNLPAQLRGDGTCVDHKAAKDWIRQNCTARVLTEEQLQSMGTETGWSEYVLLGILRPRYCD